MCCDITLCTGTCVGQDSMVAIATCYGLDSPRIESQWGRQDFLHPSRPVLGPAQPPIQWVPRLSPRVKRLGHGVDHPSPSGDETQERVGLYSPSGPLWPVLGWTLQIHLLRCEVLTVVLIKVHFVCEMTQCRLVNTFVFEMLSATIFIVV